MKRRALWALVVTVAMSGIAATVGAQAQHVQQYRRYDGPSVTLTDLLREAAEKNPELKKDIVSKLALMKSKEATDYLLELLK